MTYHVATYIYKYAKVNSQEVDQNLHNLAIFGGYAAVLWVWPEGIPKKSEC